MKVVELDPHRLMKRTNTRLDIIAHPFLTHGVLTTIGGSLGAVGSDSTVADAKFCLYHKVQG